MFFLDRADAGRQLTHRLSGKLGSLETVVVLGLPRGGVRVAHAVARELAAPMDVLVVRRLSIPERDDLVLGAVATGGAQTLNRDLIQQLEVPEETIEAVAEHERRELARAEELYRGGLPPLKLSGRTVIVVDDGLATGAAMRAALQVLVEHRPRRVIAAVPVAPPDGCAALRSVADEVVCARTPDPFLSVGRWYGDFRETTDEEVRELVVGSRTARRGARAARA